MRRHAGAALAAAVLSLALAPAVRADGTFAPPEVVAAGFTVVDVAAGRIAGDGARDLIAVTPFDAGISIQTSDRQFGAVTPVAAVGNPQSGATGDFDGDGDDDLVLKENAYARFYRNEAGVFSAVQAVVVNTGPSGSGQSEVLVDDVNGDGDPDVIVANGADATYVLHDDGDFAFNASSLPAQSAAQPRSLARADFDADGIEDLAVGTTLQGEAGSRLEIYKGTPFGNFTLVHDYAAGSAPIDNASLAATDLDADGDPDLVLAHRSTRTLVAFAGAAGTGFAAPANLTTYTPTPTGIAGGDFDRDGRGDIAVALSSAQVAVRLSSAASFGAADEALYPLGAGASPSSLRAADLDADGALDLISGSENTPYGMSVLFNEVAANLDVGLVDAPDPVAAAGDVTYTATISNLGLDDATGAQIAFTLAGGGTYKSGPAGCSATGPTVTCTVGALASGTQTTRAIVVQAPAEPGAIEVTATADASEPDPVTVNDTDSQTTTVTGTASADLELTQTDTPDPVAAGDPVTYHVTVTNHGPTSAREVVITDQLPSGAAYVNATANAGGTCQKSGGVVTCTFASLAKDASATAAIVVTPAAGGQLTNQASASSAVPDPGLSANQETETTTVDGEGAGPVTPPSVSAGPVTVAEGTGTTKFANVPVTLSAPSSRTVTVNYTTTDGSAVEGDDYQARSGTLTIAPGATQGTVAVPIKGNDVYEATKTFALDLSSPANATLGTASATVTIVDDEDPPVLDITGVRVDEAADYLEFYVDVTGRTELKARFTPVIVGGTALVSGTRKDYDNPEFGEYALSTAASQQRLRIRLVDDQVYELDDTIQVTLTQPKNATLGTASATGTIVNDDPLPTLRAPTESTTEPSGGLEVDIRFRLSSFSDLPVTFDVATVPTDAEEGQDYEAAAKTLTVPPRQLTPDALGLKLLADDVYEDDETVAFSATNVQGAVPAGEPLLARVTVSDDDQEPVPVIQPTTFSEQDAGAAIPVTLSAPSEIPLHFRPFRIDGTATSGRYSSPGVWQPGDYSLNTSDFRLGGDAPETHTMEVGPVSDGVAEGPETFQVEISRLDITRIPAFAGPGRAGATMQLVDGPVAPTIRSGPVIVFVGGGAADRVRVGDGLRCGSEFNGAPDTVTTRWTVDGIQRDDDDRYVVAAADAGRSIRCHVRAVNNAGRSAEAVSPPVRVGAQVPAVGVMTETGSIAVAGGSALPVLACSQPRACVGSVAVSTPVARAGSRAAAATARTRYALIGKARFRLAAGASRPVAVKLNKRGRKLARQGPVPVRVTTKTKSGRSTKRAVQNLALG